ncbi:MAG: HU family DNA-binding protein [Firmicutes bacterium]|nr:HU family DNA-binding protein [Bacillota bacterium]
MREKEFIEKLAEKWEVTKKEAEAFMDAYHALVKEVLKKNGELTLNDMGKYVLQNRPAREARNPMTGETVKVPAKTVAKWRPNKKFKDEVFGK